MSLCSSTCVVVSGVGTLVDIVTSCEHWYGSAVCVCVGYHNCVSVCGQHCAYNIVESTVFCYAYCLIHSLHNKNEIITAT